MTQNGLVNTNIAQGAYRMKIVDLEVVSSLHMEMMTGSHIPNLLKTSWVVENGQGTLHYQVTSKLSAQEYFARYTLSPLQLKKLLKQMVILINNIDQHFLNPSAVILNFDLLFIDPYKHEPFMMYDPNIVSLNEDDTLGKLYKLISHIVIEKAMVEKGEGLDELLEVMNLMKCTDSRGCRDAINAWIHAETGNVNAPETASEQVANYNEVADKHLGNSTIEKHTSNLFREVDEGIKSRGLSSVKIEKLPDNKIQPDNKTLPLKGGHRVKINQLDTNETKTGDQIKSSIMTAIILIVVLLASLSFVRPIGWLEILITCLISLAVLLLSCKYKVKKYQELETVQIFNHENHDADCEVDWNAEMDHGRIKMVQSLYDDRFKNQSALEFTSTFLESKTASDENRTVMLEPARPYPILKAINIGVEDIEIKQEKLLIGRCPASSDVILSSNTVGRIHAELVLNGNELKVKDFNTLNGTYINGERIHEHYTFLENMDVIKFSCFEFRVVMP